MSQIVHHSVLIVGGALLLAFPKGMWRSRGQRTDGEQLDLRGVVLSKIDYAAAITYVDPWWRVYAPATAASITLPESLSPFTSGEDVWITPFGVGYDQPFDYDLFPVDILLGPMSQYSEDSWAVMVP